MRILILEDDPARLEWFRSMTIGCNVDVTKDVEEAKRWFDENEYDQIFLDHDLCDEHYAVWEQGVKTYDATTGYAVAKHIAESDRSPRANIIIHSMNPTGSRRMEQALQSRGALWVSFPILKANAVTAMSTIQ